MATSASHTPLHTHLERATGSGDLRLLYGLGVPFFLMTLLIIGGLAIGAGWLVAVLMVLIAAFAGVVVAGLDAMLSEEEDER